MVLNSQMVTISRKYLVVLSQPCRAAAQKQQMCKFVSQSVKSVRWINKAVKSAAPFLSNPQHQLSNRKKGSQRQKHSGVIILIIMRERCLKNIWGTTPNIQGVSM